MFRPVRSQIVKPTSDSGFNPYAAGKKHYGSGRSMPTTGAVDKLGYAERDSKAAARREALLRRARG